PSSVEARADVGLPVAIGARIALRGARDMTRLGDALHACLAADRRGCDPEDRLATVARILGRWRADVHLDAEDVLGAAEALWTWLDLRWPGARLHRELPLQHRRADGAIVR